MAVLDKSNHREAEFFHVKVARPIQVVYVEAGFFDLGKFYSRNV